jgi:L-fuculose-phosphate aldolase
VYWGTLAIGGPTLLAEDEMDRILLRFKSYGQR